MDKVAKRKRMVQRKQEKRKRREYRLIKRDEWRERKFAKASKRKISLWKRIIGR